MGVQRRPNNGRSLGPDDRRGSCRYTVVEDQAWLGWWDGPSYVTTPAKILDLSLRGAMLQVETLPVNAQVVWFCPPGGQNPEWLEAKPVQSKKRLLGPREIRIAFRRIFPYETFKALVYGRDAASAVEVQPYIAEVECNRDEW